VDTLLCYRACFWNVCFCWLGVLYSPTEVFLNSAWTCVSAATLASRQLCKDLYGWSPFATKNFICNMIGRWFTTSLYILWLLLDATIWFITAHLSCTDLTHPCCMPLPHSSLSSRPHTLVALAPLWFYCRPTPLAGKDAARHLAVASPACRHFLPPSTLLNDPVPALLIGDEDDGSGSDKVGRSSSGSESFSSRSEPSSESPMFGVGN
jgi:hypothetical protein